MPVKKKCSICLTLKFNPLNYQPSLHGDAPNHLPQGRGLFFESSGNANTLPDRSKPESSSSVNKTGVSQKSPVTGDGVTNQGCLEPSLMLRAVIYQSLTENSHDNKKTMRWHVLRHRTSQRTHDYLHCPNLAWSNEIRIAVCLEWCEMRSRHIAAALMLIVTSAHAATSSEVECLVKVMHSEARGESLEGLIAVGQATLNRARKNGAGVCQLTGVTRRQPPMGMAMYYKALAASLISHTSNSIAKGADSWNTGTKPRQPGNITRIIDGHVFYVAKADQ